MYYFLFFSVMRALCLNISHRGEVGLLNSLKTASCWISACSEDASQRSVMVWHVTGAVAETSPPVKKKKKKKVLLFWAIMKSSSQCTVAGYPMTGRLAVRILLPSCLLLYPWPRHLTQNCSQWGWLRLAWQQSPISVGMSEWEAFVKYLGVPLRY